MEQLAANAERASIKYKQVEFMGERLGEEYDGVISGITEWGLYVETTRINARDLCRYVTSKTTITSRREELLSDGASQAPDIPLG